MIAKSARLFPAPSDVDSVKVMSETSRAVPGVAASPGSNRCDVDVTISVVAARIAARPPSAVSIASTADAAAGVVPASFALGPPSAPPPAGVPGEGDAAGSASVVQAAAASGAASARSMDARSGRRRESDGLRGMRFIGRFSEVRTRRSRPWSDYGSRRTGSQRDAVHDSHSLRACINRARRALMDAMDRLEVLKAFVRLVEKRSFTEVARELSSTQPTISRQLAELEDRLAVRLLHRTTRRVTPTEAGLVYYERARAALAALEEADEAVGRSAAGYKGQFRVTAPFAYGCHVLAPALRDFTTRFPNVQIDLLLDDRYVDLVREGIDVAIRIGSLPDSTYHARSLGFEELVVVASPAYLRARGTPRSVDELDDHTGIALLNGGRPLRWAFRTEGGVVQKPLLGPLRVDSMLAAHAAARAGLGVTVLPTYVVDDDLTSGVLVNVLPDARPVGFRIHAVLPAARGIPARVKAFTSFLASAIKEGAARPAKARAATSGDRAHRRSS